MTDVKLDLQNISLQSVTAYRTMYALTDIKRGTGKLHATHFVVCLEYGRFPMWGVFSAVTGRLINRYGSREWVKRAYPKKIFRRMQVLTSFGQICEELSRDQREQHIELQVDKAHPFDETPLTDKQRARLQQIGEERGLQSL